MQEDVVNELREEMRKLKTVIVKQENRIRVLESAMQLKLKEDERNDKPPTSPVDKELLASDEV